MSMFSRWNFRPSADLMLSSLTHNNASCTYQLPLLPQILTFVGSGGWVTVTRIVTWSVTQRLRKSCSPSWRRCDSQTWWGSHFHEHGWTPRFLPLAGTENCCLHPAVAAGRGWTAWRPVRNGQRTFPSAAVSSWDFQLCCPGSGCKAHKVFNLPAITMSWSTNPHLPLKEEAS